MWESKVLISDPSLRDGNNAVSQQITKEQIKNYCLDADEAGVPIIEVGHGYGLGASSLHFGLALVDNFTMLETARNNITKGKLGIHVIPGIATIKKDLERALAIGVDVVRIVANSSEADISQEHIEFVRNNGKEAYGALMMSHLASPETLLEEAQKMEMYGAQGIIIMDSAGAYLPHEVKERISFLVQGLKIPVGFHAKNNLGLAMANTLTAIASGATIIDASIRGFGIGAGNAPLEVLVGVLDKLHIETGINLYKILNAADHADKNLIPTPVTINSDSIVSGLSGVFSGLSQQVQRIAKECQVDTRDLYFELGKRKEIIGQEYLIYEVALELSRRNSN